ncbi:hypothetical protein HRR83_000181 [Exophiala dermatitidis]|uniref:Uncharacterized protein n=1 Tax=Exophiala dermatitidis TaxID=5970 RepID=A0AAN6F2Y2_EXODE|nr:hypothetical protein HRR73_002717 [Exophiala dermatitidis]KAJ4527428.1 hypothetical protein HRR74_000182 [Exophiala dermatitidis]KAJ4530993.1 hypothetical protein HRR76_008679 [Exophiala dermatitidis]KAJ4585005.1 hypothetical protein HRR81_000812 [Exophiala dermatitidis]KAJ4589869.1 hypothetical protein HRR82_000269 [Exophiala dermatitidis]
MPPLQSIATTITPAPGSTERARHATPMATRETRRTKWLDGSDSLGEKPQARQAPLRSYWLVAVKTVQIVCPVRLRVGLSTTSGCPRWSSYCQSLYLRLSDVQCLSAI